MNRISALSSLLSWQSAIRFLAICSICGAFCGAIIFSPLLGSSVAIGIIDLGRIEVGRIDVGTLESGRIEIGKTRPVEEIIALSTRMIAKEFTDAVAERLSDPSAAEDLLASVYGGQGDLKIRVMRDWYRIEIRVSSTSEKIAIERLTAVMDEVLAQHKIAADKLLVSYQRQHKFEQRLRVDAEKRFQEIFAEVVKSGKTGADLDILTFRAELMLPLISQSIVGREQSDNEPFIIESAVLAGPSPFRPLIRSYWRAAILGAIAGFALGLMAIQIRRAVV